MQPAALDEQAANRRASAITVGLTIERSACSQGIRLSQDGLPDAGNQELIESLL